MSQGNDSAQHSFYSGVALGVVSMVALGGYLHARGLSTISLEDVLLFGAVVASACAAVVVSPDRPPAGEPKYPYLA